MSCEQTWIEVNFVHQFDLFNIIIIFYATASPSSCSYEDSVIFKSDLFNSVNCESIVICNRVSLLEQNVALGLLMRFKVNINDMVRRQEGDNFSSKLSTSTNAKNILHQPIPLLNYNKLGEMHSQNQFITSQQQQHLYLNNLLELKNNRAHKDIANTYAQSIVNKLAQRLQEGRFKIDDNTTEINNLLQEKKLSESQKRLLHNRIKNEEKSRRNRLLYPKNRSKSQLSNQQYPSAILSPQRHKQLMASIRVFKIKKEQLMKKSREKQAKQLQKSQQEMQKQKEGERLNEIQKKKEKIQQNLKKMRENHQEFVRQEQQSKQIINQIRNKKKLYQHLKESYEQSVLVPIQEENKKKLQEIKLKSRLDLQQIQNHEKQYIERKKSQEKESTLEKSNITDNLYNPPEHTLKIKKILAEQQKQKHKIQMQKKMILQKIQRVSNYTNQLRKKHLPSKTITTQRQPSEKLSTQIYLLDRRRKKIEQEGRELRRRAKTQEGQKGLFSREQAKKSRNVTSKTVQLDQRQKHIQKLKKDEIERILSFGNCSPQQKLSRIRTVDQKLSLQLKKKETKLRRLTMNKKQDQSMLQLMLGTIKAKLNLLTYYETVQ